jgi:hypothetical protein
VRRVPFLSQSGAVCGEKNMKNETEKLRQFVLAELARIRKGIETDRFTIENITALEAKLRA